jgi:shikimate kinase
LRADLETLLSRVHKQEHRPLLMQDDPEKVLKNLIEKRYPIYEQSDITVKNNDISPDKTVDLVLEQLALFFENKKQC